MLKIHVHAIVTNDDGVPQNNSLAASIQDLINKTNQIYAAADMQLIFDPAKDYEEVSSSALNRDFPASYVQPDGSKVYPKDPDGNELNPYLEARTEYTKKYPGKAIIFFRHVGAYATATAYSSGNSPFVAYSAGIGAATDLAHETGHFFHLAHPFSEVNLTAAEKTGTQAQQVAAMLAHLQDRLKNAVASGGFTKANALNTFDGDASSVADTPPDAGPYPFTVILGDACSATDHIDFNVTYPGDSKPTSYTYDVAADRADAGYPKPISGNWTGLPWKDEIDSVVNWNNGKAYFFRREEYVRYDIPNDQADAGYPRKIAPFWPGLWPDGIDAGVRWNNDVAYFFRGGEYIRYNIAKDKAEDGYPRPIAPVWKGIWPDGFDSVVVWNNGKAYFFKGNQYIRYDIAKDQADDNYPRTIPGNWPGLWGDGVDCALVWKNDNGIVYFFKGNQYLMYNWYADQIEAGYPKPIAGNWGGLTAGMDGGMVWDYGKAYFFKGGQYWSFDLTHNQLDLGYPLPIATGWEGIWASGIDAAIRWNNGKAYFFKNDEYISYDLAQDKADKTYPRKIKDGWKGIWPAGGIDAVVAYWNHGKAYFFKGNSYIRYDIKADAADAGYPASIGGGWTGL
jgi:hypothetical protein